MKTPSVSTASIILAAFVHCNIAMAWTPVDTSSDLVLPSPKLLPLYRDYGESNELCYTYHDEGKRRLLWRAAKHDGREEVYQQLLPDFIGSAGVSVFNGSHLYISGKLQYKKGWFISSLDSNGEIVWIRQSDDNDPSGIPKDIDFYKLLPVEDRKIIYAVGKTSNAQIILELDSSSGSDVSVEAFNKFLKRKLLHASNSSTSDELFSREEERAFRILEWLVGGLSVVGGLTLVAAIYAGYNFLKNIREERTERIARARDVESNRRKIEGDLIRKITKQKTIFSLMPHGSSMTLPPVISVVDSPQVDSDTDCTEQEQSFQLLLSAVLTGNIQVATHLLDSSPDLINQSDSSGNTLLHIATTTNNTEMIRLLLSKGANYDARNNQDFTPLHVAATHGYSDTIGLLLDAGADIELLSSKQHSPLHLAIINNHTNVATLLIESPARISERLRVINQEDYQGNTPLHLSVLARNTDIITLLLSHGANQESFNNNGFTPLYLAAINGTQDAIRIFLDWKSGFAKDEISALFHIAANFNSEALMEGLLIRGLHHGFVFYQPSIPNTINQFCVQTQSGLTVLHEAVLANSYSVVRLLLRAFLVDINAHDDQGNTSLHYAIQNNDLEMIKILLSEGADINRINTLGYTPLHLAVQLQNVEVAEYLLDEDEHQSANPNVRALDGRTPLDISCERGLLDIVRVLAPVTRLQSLGNETFATILHRMFVLPGIDYSQLLQTLHESNAHQLFNPNTQDFSGNTPLHIALEMGLDEVSELFIRLFRPNLNIQNNEGQTPLHVALRFGNQRATQALIQRGANLQVSDNNDETALNLATSIGDQASILLIQNRIGAGSALSDTQL